MDGKEALEKVKAAIGQEFQRTTGMQGFDKGTNLFPLGERPAFIRRVAAASSQVLFPIQPALFTFVERVTRSIGYPDHK